MKSFSQSSQGKVDASAGAVRAQLIIFDLDGTLAESKAPLDPEMAGLLGDLLIHRKVAVISGASFSQFQSQFLAHLDFFKKDVSEGVNGGAEAAGSVLLGNLSILPTGGSSFYKYVPSDSAAAATGGWSLVYQNPLSPEEKARIREAVASAAGSMHVEKIYGEQLEDRGSQMTFSALGQEAPISAKQSWDPEHTIREAMVTQLRPLLPDFEMNIGGMTSIDITKKGMDKEYGINAVIAHFSIPKTAVVYVGDAIFPGGNDYAAVTAGVPTHPVKNVAETKDFIRQIIRGIMETQK